MSGDIVGTNWSGTYTYRAPRLVDAESVEQVQQAVAGSVRVRALGTRHSFSDIADCEETLVSVVGLPSTPVIDDVARTVTVGAGMTYGELARFLERNGWALHNMASLPHISIGGAISTATHGSGNHSGSLATAVQAVELIGADAELTSIERGDERFAGTVVALGCLGVLVGVTLDIEPSYLVRQDVYRGLGWPAVLSDLDAVMGAGSSVSLFTTWSRDTVGEMLVKSRLDATTQGAEAPDGGDVPDELFGAPRQVEVDTGGPPGNMTTRGVAGAWSDQLPHFRLEGTPSLGDEIQTEYLVARSHGVEALEAILRLHDVISPHLAVSELRTTRADGLWLSPSYDRDCLCIHFTWKNHPDGVRAALPVIEGALALFEARPHWGKLFDVDSLDVDELYPRAGNFRALRAALDPKGKFTNRFIHQAGLA